MPSYAPRHFDSFDADEWIKLLDNADKFSRLIRTVGYDCMRAVARARVQEVDTRLPHSHYL